MLVSLIATIWGTITVFTVTRDITAILYTTLLVVFAAPIIYVVSAGLLDLSNSKQVKEMQSYMSDLKEVRRAYAELYEGYQSGVNACYEGLCSEGCEDALCMELNLPKSIKLAAGGVGKRV